MPAGDSKYSLCFKLHCIAHQLGAATAAEHAVQLSALDTEMAAAAQLHSEVRSVATVFSVTAIEVTVLVW
jgi:hypothetical protein